MIIIYNTDSPFLFLFLVYYIRCDVSILVSKPAPYFETAWPSVPYEDTARRQFLEDVFYTPLKKKNGLCGIVVLGEDRDEILSIDAEPKLSATHDDTGKDFPWKVEAAETCCAAASTLVLCTIS